MNEPTPWTCFNRDLERYGGWSAFWREQSLWAVAWYRFGCALERLPIPVVRTVVIKGWWFFFRFIEMLTGVSLPLGAKIGPGLRIWHFGGIFVNSNTVIGANCTMRQGVTLGNRHDDQLAPVLGDNVDLGAYAQVLGPVILGDGAKVGAMSVVLQNVDAGCSAVGVPARIIESRQP